MSYQYILFDLDGTLTDPGIGITNSVMYALEKYNIKVSERSELYKFIGPPLIDSFMDFYGFTKEMAVQAVAYYREYFSVHGIYENQVYDQIREMLQTLVDKKKTLLVATSKPEEFAKIILKHFQMDSYFTLIAGSTMDETRTKKAEVIEYALQSLNITDKHEVIMIGDREHDIIGARTCNLDSIGVLYGYGDRRELEEAGASFIAESPMKILEIIDSCEEKK